MLSLEELIVYTLENYGYLMKDSLLTCVGTYALESAYDSADSITASLSAKTIQSKEAKEKAAIRQMLECIELSSDKELEEAKELIIERDNKINKQEPIKVKVYKQRGNIK